MRTHTKPLDLYKAQLKYFETAGRTLVEGHREGVVDPALADAKELTSGGLSRAQTRGAFARGQSSAQSYANGLRRQLSGRQIARRGLGKGGVPMLPINRLTGELERSFRIVPQNSALRTVRVYDLVEENPGGGIFRLLPGGTRKMVDSGFFRAIRNRWRPRNKAFLDYYRDKQKQI